ncbi:acid-activated periplasmic chaperone HdeA [uncultured Endozoicomonas sp.]|uniref:acid-activated periplasmic chaperone HdeA n=1 Tax=uncultured Endozoicomonas sp. TaxID=432652 RepID=UPI00261ED62D|nr:acid-activated periplasmic chaperone HdeA [uncultured Endozoicomonas sp.]
MMFKLSGLAVTAIVLSINAHAATKQKADPSSGKPAKPISSWTCEDFISLQENYQPYAIAWATAYSKAGKPEGTDFDTEGMETIRPTLLQFCNRNPKASFWDKVKAETKKVF